MNKKIKIVILAAGKGVRMQSPEPKALAMLKNTPFLIHILETIKKLDKNIEPVIVVGYKKERIKEVLGEEHIYAEQTEQLGTGHAVMSAKNFIGSPHEIVLVISVDQPMVSKETLEKIISVHCEKSPTITMATVTLPDFNDWRSGLNSFGRIIRGADGRIEKIVEYKDASEEEKKIKEVNPALYACDANWLWENIPELKNENAQKEYYLTDLVKMAFEQNKKIETIKVSNVIEGLQPNSKQELEMLENMLQNML